ncbi:lipopolysaccharide assembly protein LapB [Aliivibrio sp. 1S128]|uniref:tetratricopeptide repeat protein n=1 Tax=Aliivibrio sp. 1S128 TaxID=1840085 RepID=UPI000AC42E9E|nr:hypothetical protein [Aliivibrio sp. 1S128]
MNNAVKKYAAIGLVSLLGFSMPSYAAEGAEPVNQAQKLSPEQQLAYTAQNKNESVEKRADALRQLARYPNQNSLVAVARGLKESDPQLREAAIIGSDLYQFEYRWRMISPLLTDSDLTVRMTATTNLLREYSAMTAEQQQQIEQPYNEVVVYLSEQLEEPKNTDSQLLLADVYRWHKEWKKADSLYQPLVKNSPNNSQAWLNLSDNYRAQNKDIEALEVLNKGIAQLPKEASLYYSKALTQVRLNQKESAANAIKIAATLAENNSYYWYLTGVLQENIDIDFATESLEKAYLISGSPEQLYAVCDIYVRHGNEKADACLVELAKIAPEYVITQLKEKQTQSK